MDINGRPFPFIKTLEAKRITQKPLGCEDASKDFDVDIDVRFPETANATRQKQIVEDLIVNKIDALAISPMTRLNSCCPRRIQAIACIR